MFVPIKIMNINYCYYYIYICQIDSITNCGYKDANDNDGNLITNVDVSSCHLIHSSK